ncbi:MAG: FAD-dependent oxidoreductase [Desulfobacterales bacterium]|nr:FAD-dependent oxidoreductase [Desulfobacterales bacterium]
MESGDHILGREDADAAGILHQTFAGEGMSLQLGVKIIAVEQQGSDKLLILEQQDGQRRSVAVGQILVGVGRAPNVEGLGLEAAEASERDRSGVSVNDRLQAGNPCIYAAGDCCSAYKFTHTADAMARILLANALFKGRQTVAGLVIHRCTYTDPEIAHVGMYERDAAAQGIAVTTLTVPASERGPEPHWMEKHKGLPGYICVRAPDRILGATIVARHAGEMIERVHPGHHQRAGPGFHRPHHPSLPDAQAEVIKKLADAYNRSRLDTAG